MQQLPLHLSGVTYQSANQAATQHPPANCTSPPLRATPLSCLTTHRRRTASASSKQLKAASRATAAGNARLVSQPAGGTRLCNSVLISHPHRATDGAPLDCLRPASLKFGSAHLLRLETKGTKGSLQAASSSCSSCTHLQDAASSHTL